MKLRPDGRPDRETQSAMEDYCTRQFRARKYPHLRLDNLKDGAHLSLYSVNANGDTSTADDLELHRVDFTPDTSAMAKDGHYEHASRCHRAARRYLDFLGYKADKDPGLAGQRVDAGQAPA